MVQDFKNADGIELQIGNSISGVNCKGELVQGMLTTFREDSVVLEDFDNVLHYIEFENVKVGHAIVEVVKGHGEYLITTIGGNCIICRMESNNQRTFDGDAKALHWANKIAKALNRKKV